MAIIQGTTRFGVAGPAIPYPGFAASVSAAITGTVISDPPDEADIVAGGHTIIITLTADTWVASGAAFNAQRQNIIDGLDSAGAEATGWNAEVRDKEVVGAVVRTSDTVVTITLTAAASYDITANETITVTVPASALVTSSSDVTSAPTFDVTTVAAVATEPRGSTRWDQRHHPQYDFGEHYPSLRQEDKDRIDEIIAKLKPKQRERLAKGRPSKSVRKKIAEVIPDYPQYKPKPQAEYIAEIGARMEAQTRLDERTEQLMREMDDEEAAIITMLLLQ